MVRALLSRRPLGKWNSDQYDQIPRSASRAEKGRIGEHASRDSARFTDMSITCRRATRVAPGA